MKTSKNNYGKMVYKKMCHGCSLGDWKWSNSSSGSSMAESTDAYNTKFRMRPFPLGFQWIAGAPKSNQRGCLSIYALVMQSSPFALELN